MAEDDLLSGFDLEAARKKEKDRAEEYNSDLLSGFDPKYPSGRAPPSPAPDTSFDPVRTAKQFALGIPRFLFNLSGMMGPGADVEFAQSAGAVGLPEFSAQEPRSLTEHMAIARAAQEKMGLEGDENSPRNMPERLASAAGGGAASGLMLGPAGLAGNMLVGGVSGVSGQGARELFDDSPVADLLGSIAGGAGASALLNWGRALTALMRGPALIGDAQIPVTRGVATNDPEQLGWEEMARKGGHGVVAGRIMRSAQERTAAAVEEARQNIGATLGDQPVVAGDAAANVSQSLRERAEQLHGDATRLYESAANKDAWIEGARHVDQQVEARLAAENFRTDEIRDNRYGNYQGSSAAMRILDNLSERVGPTTQPIKLTEIEQARKGINKIRVAPNTEDQRGLIAIKDTFDQWTQDAIDLALVHGDKTAINDLRNARSLWSQYLRLTRAKTGDDVSGVITRIVNKDMNPAEVNNYLLNMNSLGASGTAARVARRVGDLFGRDSYQWQIMRQEAYLRAAIDPSVLPNVQNRGPMALARSLTNFTDGNGRPLAEALFSSGELDRMREFATTLRRIAPGMQNPSGTAGQYARYIWPVLQGGWGAITLGAAYELGDRRYLYFAAAPLFAQSFKASKAFMAANARPTAPAPPRLLRTLPGVLSRIPGLGQEQ